MRRVARALCVTPVWRPLACYSYPPFHEENHAALYRKIKTADYTFDEEYWSMVSDTAKDLIRKVRRGARRHDPRVKIPQTRAPGFLSLSSRCWWSIRTIGSKRARRCATHGS